MGGCRGKPCDPNKEERIENVTYLPVSVCIPVRNEERNLPDCLRSLQGQFDDVVVVDSGSVDSTKAIAFAHRVTVLNFQWNGAYPKKRNWTLLNHKFKHPWVLFLDADERLTQTVLEEFQRVLSNSQHVGFWLSFTNWFMGRPLKHGDPFRKLALFRVDAGQYEQFPEESWTNLDMEVHEHPVLNGTIGTIRSRLEHHGYSGIANHIAKHNEYSTWEANRFLWLETADDKFWADLNARQKFKYKHLTRWWLPWLYFCVAFFAKRGIFDGWEGWTLARLKMRYFDEIRLKIIDAKRRLPAQPSGNNNPIRHNLT